jgi:hypothetical protein
MSKQSNLTSNRDISFQRAGKKPLFYKMRHFVSLAQPSLFAKWLAPSKSEIPKIKLHFSTLKSILHEKASFQPKLEAIYLLSGK